MTALIMIFLSIPSSYVAASTMPHVETPYPVHQLAPKAKQSKTIWRPARYRGLTMGKSREADLLRILGKQKWSEAFDENGSDAEVWHHYEAEGEFSGELVFAIDKSSRVILNLSLYPKNLSKEEAIKHFGNDYVVTRYDFDDCLGDEESAPLYESQNGSVIKVEYRHRGIAIAVTKSGRVDDITYVSKPMGAVTSKCKEAPRR